MKTVHIITGLATGGAERSLYNLLQGGLNETFEAHVISLSNTGTMGPKIAAMGVPIITIDMPIGRPTLSGVIKFRKVIRELQPDLIQGWMYHGNLAATLAYFLLLKKAPLVWNVRHSLYGIENEKRLTQLVIKANRFFSNSPTALLYNSQVSRKQHEKFGFSAEGGRVIPNGIDLKRFSFSSLARQRTRAELAISTDALVVGHVARLHPMKDHALFLKAAVDIAQRHANTHFLMSGRGVSLDDGNLKQHIPAALHNRFHLLNERNDVPELMSAMDIFCQSSWSEAFPNVLGEAMAVRLPCVATDVGDSALIVGDYGVMVTPREINALATGIESLLLLSTTDRQLLGEQARKRIEVNFALPAIVKQYATLYKTLILEKSKT